MRPRTQLTTALEAMSQFFGGHYLFACLIGRGSARLTPPAYSSLHRQFGLENPQQAGREDRIDDPTNTTSVTHPAHLFLFFPLLS